MESGAVFGVQAAAAVEWSDQHRRFGAVRNALTMSVGTRRKLVKFRSPLPLIGCTSYRGEVAWRGNTGKSITLPVIVCKRYTYWIKLLRNYSPQTSLIAYNIVQ